MIERFSKTQNEDSTVFQPDSLLIRIGYDDTCKFKKTLKGTTEAPDDLTFFCWQQGDEQARRQKAITIYTQQIFAGNVPAYKLAQKNISDGCALSGDAEHPRIDDFRIKDDPVGNARLQCWILFPYAQAGSSRDLAGLHREGYTLMLRYLGYEETDPEERLGNPRPIQLSDDEKRRLKNQLNAVLVLALTERLKQEPNKTAKFRPLSAWEERTKKVAVDELVGLVACRLPDGTENPSAIKAIWKDLVPNPPEGLKGEELKKFMEDRRIFEEGMYRALLIKGGTTEEEAREAVAQKRISLSQSALLAALDKRYKAGTLGRPWDEDELKTLTNQGVVWKGTNTDVVPNRAGPGGTGTGGPGGDAPKFDVNEYALPNNPGQLRAKWAMDIASINDEQHEEQLKAFELDGYNGLSALRKKGKNNMTAAQLALYWALSERKDNDKLGKAWQKEDFDRLDKLVAKAIDEKNAGVGMTILYWLRDNVTLEDKTLATVLGLYGLAELAARGRIQRYVRGKLGLYDAPYHKAVADVKANVYERVHNQGKGEHLDSKTKEAHKEIADWLQRKREAGEFKDLPKDTRDKLEKAEGELRKNAEDSAPPMAEKTPREVIDKNIGELKAKSVRERMFGKRAALALGLIVGEGEPPPMVQDPPAMVRPEQRPAERPHSAEEIARARTAVRNHPLGGDAARNHFKEVCKTNLPEIMKCTDPAERGKAWAEALNGFAGNNGLEVPIEVKFEKPGVKVEPSPGMKVARVEHGNGRVTITIPDGAAPIDIAQDSYGAMYDAHETASGRNRRPAEDVAAEQHVLREEMGRTLHDVLPREGRVAGAGERAQARGTSERPVVPVERIHVSETGTVHYGDVELGPLHEVADRTREKIEARLKELEKKEGKEKERKILEDIRDGLKSKDRAAQTAALKRAHEVARIDHTEHRHKLDGEHGGTRARLVVFVLLLEAGLAKFGLDD